MQEVRIRLAGAQQKVSYKDKFEIVSLAGALGIKGCHLHLSVSDPIGKTTGGHLIFGNIVYTTAENSH